MQPIRTLIVDDEPAARAGLRQLLAVDPEVVVAGECASGREAVAAIQDAAPDLLFLDVQMPELDGFGVLREIGTEGVPAVVFVTAYDQYALRAFEVHALDYLLKPFSDARFRESLTRAKEQVRRGRLGQLSRRLAALLDTYEESATHTSPPPGATSSAWSSSRAARSRCCRSARSSGSTPTAITRVFTSARRGICCAKP